MKARFLPSIVAVAILASGCIPSLTGAQATASSTAPTGYLQPISTPAVTPSPSALGACAYMWAAHDLPELSAMLDRQLRSVDAGATGTAYAYGEDCVQADGVSTFSAMETDFQIQVLVEDLSDRQALGDWIAKVMTVILALPASEVEGPQPGRVEFEFRGPDSDVLRVNVDIRTYEALGAGLEGSRLFELLNAGP